MLEEIAAIETVAETSLDPPASMHLADVSARYHDASQLLGDLIETTHDADRRQAIQDIVNARVAREAEVRGSISLVGRG